MVPSWLASVVLRFDIGRMPVDVRFYPTLRPIAGGKMGRFHFEQGTVRDVLRDAGAYGGG